MRNGEEKEKEEKGRKKEGTTRIDSTLFVTWILNNLFIYRLGNKILNMYVQFFPKKNSRLPIPPKTNTLYM